MGQIHRFQADFTWSDVARQAYKEADGESWRGITRAALVGGPDGRPTPFHVRYFEVEPGGYSSHEYHNHEHVVVVMRGAGIVRLGDQEQPACYGDVIYVGPGEPHQFRNPVDATEPFGFLCVVAAERDRPIVVGGGPSACEVPWAKADVPKDTSKQDRPAALQGKQPPTTKVVRRRSAKSKV